MALSELNWRLFEQANKNPLIDTIIFAQDVHVPVEFTPLPVMKLVEGYGFSGIMVATNVRLANVVSTFPCPIKRFFYVWDLEWLNARPLGHEYFHRAYTNSAYDIIARSDQYAKLLENNWGAKVKHVMPILDFVALTKYKDSQAI